MRGGSAARVVRARRIAPPAGPSAPGPSAPGMVFRAASAPAALAPAFSRAVIEIKVGLFIPPSPKKFAGVATSRAANRGMKTSTGVSRLNPRNPRGSTPTTTASRPAIPIVRPIAVGSPPSRARQNASVTTTTGSAPMRCSAGAKPRPSAGRCPTTSKNRSVTNDTPIRCAPASAATRTP